MEVRIRHESDQESVLLCTINRPEEIVEVVSFLSRAGGIYLSPTQKQTGDLVYRFAYSEKQFYAEIVVHDEPQA